MKYYQVIEIVNEEPLKIGAGGNKESNNEPSKDYIPGSTLVGALIGAMLRSGACTDDSVALMLKNISCYNAYPYRYKQLFVPTPRHLRVNKHLLRQARAKKEEVVQVNNLLRGSDGEDQTNNKEQEHRDALDDRFICIQADRLLGVKVERSYTLHHSHSLNADLKEKDNLFNYQAIAPQMTFRALIAYDESIKEQVERALSYSDRWYLGGSKGSGYGLCRLKPVEEAVTDYTAAKELLGLEYPVSAEQGDEVTGKRRLVITCLSDCLFRDARGQPINHLPVCEVKRLGGLPEGAELVLSQLFVQTGLTEGYNTTWRGRYPKETTVKAGSVMAYELTGDWSSAEVAKIACRLEKHLAGFRTRDGYGWLAVNIDYPTNLQLTEPKASSIPEVMVADENHDDDTAAVMGIIRQGLQEARERWLRLLAVSSLDSGSPDFRIQRRSKQPGKSLSTQFNLWRTFIDRWLDNGFVQTGQLSDYAKDTKICAVAGCSFSTVVEFLNNQAEDNAKKRLEAYANHMLNSQSGQLYYDQFQDRQESGKRFIAELLSQGLYICAREAKG